MTNFDQTVQAIDRKKRARKITLLMAGCLILPVWLIIYARTHYTLVKDQSAVADTFALEGSFEFRPFYLAIDKSGIALTSGLDGFFSNHHLLGKISLLVFFDPSLSGNEEDLERFIGIENSETILQKVIISTTELKPEWSEQWHLGHLEEALNETKTFPMPLKDNLICLVDEQGRVVLTHKLEGLEERNWNRERNRIDFNVRLQAYMKKRTFMGPEYKKPDFSKML